MSHPQQMKDSTISCPVKYGVYSSIHERFFYLGRTSSGEHYILLNFERNKKHKIKKLDNETEFASFFYYADGQPMFDSVTDADGKGTFFAYMQKIHQRNNVGFYKLLSAIDLLTE